MSSDIATELALGLATALIKAQEAEIERQRLTIRCLVHAAGGSISITAQHVSEILTENRPVKTKREGDTQTYFLASTPEPGEVCTCSFCVAMRTKESEIEAKGVKH